MSTVFVVKVASEHAWKPLGFVEHGYDEERVISRLKEKHPWAVKSTFVFVPEDRAAIHPQLELIAPTAPTE